MEEMPIAIYILLGALILLAVLMIANWILKRKIRYLTGLQERNLNGALSPEDQEYIDSL